MKSPYSLISTILLTISLFFSQASISQSVIFKNAGSISGDSVETCKIATDSKGSVYIAGVYNSTSLNFGGATINNNGKINLFVAKYDTSGNVLWIKSFGGNYSGYPIPYDEGPVRRPPISYSTSEQTFKQNSGALFNSLVVDRNGDILIAGNFYNQFSFDSYNLTSTGKADGFITKIGKNGNVIWAKQIGGDSSETINDLSVDYNNNILICGKFTGKDYTLGGTILQEITTGKGNLFYAKLDSNANTLWAKMPIQYSYSYTYSSPSITKIRALNNGTIILYGTILQDGKLNFIDKYPYNSIGAIGSSFQYQVAYIVKVSSAGEPLEEYQCSRPGKGDNDDRSAAALVYISPSQIFLKSKSFTGLSTRAGYENFYTIDSAISINEYPGQPYSYPKLNMVNKFSFSSFFYILAGDAYNYTRLINDMAGDNIGNLYCAGGFSDTSYINTDFTLLRLDENMKLADSVTSGHQQNPVNSIGTSIAIDTVTNTLFVAGTYNTSGSFNIGNSTLGKTPNGFSDIFFLKAWRDTSVKQSFLPLSIKTNNDTTVCYGRGAQLTAKAMEGSKSYSYTWVPATGLDNSKIANPFAAPTVTTSYIVTVTDTYGNTAKDTVTINVLPAPTTPVITASRTVLCGDDAITLTSSAAVGNYWTNNTNDTTQSIVVRYPMSYYVKVFDGNGCESSYSAPINITKTDYTPIAPVITTSGPTTFCDGGSIILTSSAANNNLWSNGATTQSITVNNSGNYSVTVTAGGCTSAASTPIITVKNPVPATPLVTAGGPTTFCDGASVTLTSSAVNNNLWSNGATTQSITVNNSDSYSVKVTTGGCESVASSPIITIKNAAPATPVVTADGPTTFCDGASVTLASSAVNDNLWSNGATTQSITVNNSGSYSVKVTTGGCESAASSPITTTKNTAPSIPVITQSGNVLTSSATTGNKWYKEGSLLTGETNQTLTITESAGYTVTVTNTNGCSSTSESFVGVAQRPVAFSHKEYPNPVTNDLTISYTIPSTQNVGISIVNINGTEVMLVQDKKQQAAGAYTLTVTNIASRLEHGIYVIKYVVDNKTTTQKLIVQ